MLKTKRGDVIGSGTPLLRDDLLEGIAAIARHTGIAPRRVSYLVASERLPVFRLGKVVCARKSELDEALRAESSAA